MHLPRALRAFLLASFGFTLLCAGTEAVCRYLLHLGDPYDSPVLRTPLRFVDFHDFFPKFAHFHSPAFFDHATSVLPYPAPALVAYEIFLIPSPTQYHGSWAIARFEGTLLSVSIIGVVLLFRWLRREGLRAGAAAGFTATVYLCAFPFWFDFFLGNIEWIIWLFLMCGVWAYTRRFWKFAAVCIGIAGSMKIFPFVLLGLFVPLRRWKEVVLALAAAAISTGISLWLVCPDIAFSARETLKALGLFKQNYMMQVRPVETGFDHSIFAAIKLLLRAGSGHRQASVGAYLIIVAVGGCVLFFTRIQRMPATNQVLCLIVAAILLPPVSYEYTLLHLYAVLLLLIHIVLRHAHRGEDLPAGLLATLMTLAFLLAPQQEWILGGMRVAGQVRCVALLVLGYLGLRYPFPLRGLRDQVEGPELNAVPTL